MESCWSNHRPAYRCRHGHTSATPPDPGRPSNAYVREDHILPHLPALLVRLTATAADAKLPQPGSSTPPTEADAVGHLRAKALTLTFDPATRTLAADTQRAERITIG
ncbi:hypothetical protein AB0I10_40910 [Streptomyces sp. NPDC050636]|uniref:hypothetical protein n=1 Tax=Streptomyces sp. NPDC050636 TaxID=3154510 RepID=UPI0034282588